MLNLRTVLVADESIVFRQLISTLLGPHCERVIAVGDAASALAAIEEHGEISLALIETCLPGDGLRVLEQVSRRTGMRPTVLMIVPRCDPDLETRATLLGAVSVLTKPITFRAIRRALRADQIASSAPVAPRAYAAPPASALLVEEEGEKPQLKLDLLDLSPTGALLATKGPLEMGTRLALVLCLDEELIPAMGRVVRIQHPTWDILPGAAVEFEGMDAAARGKIESFVARLRRSPDRDAPI